MSVITLPSHGLLYDEDSVARTGMVEIRGMKTKEEKLLTTAKNMHSLTTKILSNCIVEPTGIDPNSLIIGDRLFLLFCIRKESFGSTYDYTVKCLDCENAYKRTINVPDDLKVKTLEEDTKEPFETTLPICKKTISFRLLRGTDERIIQNHREQAYRRGAKKEDGDPAYTFRMAKHILSIDYEDVTIQKALDFYDNLDSADSLFFQQEIDKVDFGLDLSLIDYCEICGAEIETGLPLTQSFFRPKIKATNS